VLPGGGILIDNPGMREVGIADSDSGLMSTFDAIIQLSKDCKFVDCSHTNETGCAVVKALEIGKLDPDAYNNFLKMEKEKEHFQTNLVERRKKDKQFGKMLKNYKKNKDNE
jgi:ribosome biogenesis GTPase